ncbi:hypothetical protein LIP81_20000, partial [Erysipelatoclostridium ramosum]|nr:hypothetical protein [Thomasclavelia ramosa]
TRRKQSFANFIAIPSIIRSINYVWYNETIRRNGSAGQESPRVKELHQQIQKLKVNKEGGALHTGVGRDLLFH